MCNWLYRKAVTKLHINTQSKQLTKGTVCLTWKLAGVLLHKVQHEGICIGDDKPMSKNINHRSNVEVLRSIEDGFFRRAPGLCHTCPLKELSADNSGISNWRLINGDHVIGETIRDYKSTTFELRFCCVLCKKK